MSLVPLCLGPLATPGFAVYRSGVRWLCDDDHLCRPGEVIAFCNIGLVPVDRASGPTPFRGESRDFQVAFATRAGGYLRKAERSSRGGFLDLLFTHRPWRPEFTIGQLRRSPDGAPEIGADGGLELLFLVGRRATEFAEDRSGLLTGWHDRSRAWWGPGEAAHGTLLSLGICEQLGVIRGERFAFLELFEAAAGPGHVVFVADDVLVPCAPILREQLRRDAAESRAMASDLCRSIAANDDTLAPGDLIFVASLLSALQRSPLSDRYPLLTRSGMRESGPANAVLLSLNAESASVFRHRRLGYTMRCQPFRVAELSQAARSWIDTNFERVPRTLDDVRRDYDALVDAVRERSATEVLVLNAVSTEGYEDIPSYAPFDAPLGESLASVRSKELNLMLHDVARDRNVAIVDVDRIAAELGTAAHVQQGVHYSGRMQEEIRGEILRILRSRGVSGFAPRALR